MKEFQHYEAKPINNVLKYGSRLEQLGPCGVGCEMLVGVGGQDGIKNNCGMWD